MSDLLPDETEFPTVNNVQDRCIMPLHRPVAGVEACYQLVISARLAYCALLHSDLAAQADECQDYAAAAQHITQHQRASFMYDLAAEAYAQTIHIRDN